MPAATGPTLERRESRWLALATLAVGCAGAIVLRLDLLGFAPDAIPTGGKALTGFLGVLLAVLLLRPLIAREGDPVRVRVAILAVLAALPATLLIASLGGVSPLRAAIALAFVAGSTLAAADFIGLGDASGGGLGARALVLGVGLATPLLAYVGDEFLRAPTSWATISPFVLLPRLVAGDVPGTALAGWIVVAAALRVARLRRPASGATVPALCLIAALPAAPSAKTAFSDLVVPGAPSPVAVDLPQGFHGDVVVEASGRRTVFGPVLGDHALFVLRPGSRGTWPSTVPVRLRSLAVSGGESDGGVLELRSVAPGVSLGLVIGGDGDATRVARDRIEAADASGARRWIVPDLALLPPNPAALEAVDAVALLPDAGAALGEAKLEALSAWLAGGRRAVFVSTGGDEEILKRLVDGGDARAGTGRFGLGIVRAVERDVLAREDFRLPLDPASSVSLLASSPGPPMLPSLGRVWGPWLSKHAAAVLAMTAGIGVGLALAGRRSDRGLAVIVSSAVLPSAGVALVALGPLRRAPIVATIASVVELRAGSPRGRSETLVEATAVAAGSFSISRSDDSALSEWTEAPRDEPLVDLIRPGDGRVRTQGFTLGTAQSRLFRVLAPFRATGTVDVRRTDNGVEIVSRLPFALERCIVVVGGRVTATIGDLPAESTRSLRPTAEARTLRAESDDRLARGQTSEAVLLRVAAATGRFTPTGTYFVGSAAASGPTLDVRESMATSDVGALWIVDVSP